MCTPFDDDDGIDFETLRRDAQRLEAAGVDGLVPCGSTGESATMSHDEHIEVVEAVIDAVEDVPVEPQGTRPSTPAASSRWASRRSVSKSILPSSSNGVHIAGYTPRNRNVVIGLCSRRWVICYPGSVVDGTRAVTVATG